MSIRIDPEFRSIIPPLENDEFKQLEQNILAEGIRDPLVTWEQDDGNEILVDGHNRWDIAAKHGGLPFKTVKMRFESRDDVELWIIRNQKGRRNLHNLDAIALGEKEKKILAKQADARMHAGVENPAKKSWQGIGKTDRQIRRENSTDYKLAREIGISEDTYRKGKVILEKATPETIREVRSGTKSISKAYKEVIGETPKKMRLNKRGETKYCTVCGTVLNDSNISQNRINCRKYICRSCENERSRNQKFENKYGVKNATQDEMESWFRSGTTALDGIDTVVRDFETNFDTYLKSLVAGLEIAEKIVRMPENVPKISEMFDRAIQKIQGVKHRYENGDEE